MAGGKNFNFKHKNPVEVTTADKQGSPSEDSREAESIKKESPNPEPQTFKPFGEIRIIKPKAETRSRRVQLLLTESNYLKLKEYASSNGTSVNDVVNQIIESL